MRERTITFRSHLSAEKEVGVIRKRQRGVAERLVRAGRSIPQWIQGTPTPHDEFTHGLSLHRVQVFDERVAGESEGPEDKRLELEEV